MGGDPNYVLTGMILQVVFLFFQIPGEDRCFDPPKGLSPQEMWKGVLWHPSSQGIGKTRVNDFWWKYSFITGIHGQFGMFTDPWMVDILGN